MDLHGLNYRLGKVRGVLETITLCLLPLGMGVFFLCLSLFYAMMVLTEKVQFDPMMLSVPGVGLLMMSLGGLALWQTTKMWRFQRQHTQMQQAGTPWRVVPAWDAGRIVHRNSLRRPMWASFIGAGLVGTLLLFLLTVRLDTFFHRIAQLPVIDQCFLAFLVLAACVALGGYCVYVASALGALWRWLMFGPSTLVLETIPAHPGGHLSATLRTPIRRPSDEMFTITLSCQMQQTTLGPSSGTRAGRNTVETHHDTVQQAGQPDPSRGHRLNVPVRFVLPADAPPTQLLPTQEKPGCVWIVTVTQPGSSYVARWGVPVFSS